MFSLNHFPHKLYQDSELDEEKDRVAQALGVFQQEVIIDKVLEFSISEQVKSQDTVFLLASVSMTQQGRGKVWNFFKDHKTVFHQRYIGGPLISRLIKVFS